MDSDVQQPQSTSHASASTSRQAFQHQEPRAPPPRRGSKMQSLVLNGLPLNGDHHSQANGNGKGKGKATSFIHPASTTKGKPHTVSAALAKNKSVDSTIYVPVKRDVLCSFCRGTEASNKVGVPEQMVSCCRCGRSGHPKCLNMNTALTEKVLSYDWCCIECKTCEVCMSKGDDVSDQSAWLNHGLRAHPRRIDSCSAMDAIADGTVTVWIRGYLSALQYITANLYSPLAKPPKGMPIEMVSDPYLLIQLQATGIATSAVPQENQSPVPSHLTPPILLHNCLHSPEGSQSKPILSPLPLVSLPEALDRPKSDTANSKAPLTLPQILHQAAERKGHMRHSTMIQISMALRLRLCLKSV
jgi:hypothetical protein